LAGPFLTLMEQLKVNVTYLLQILKRRKEKAHFSSVEKLATKCELKCNNHLEIMFTDNRVGTNPTVISLNGTVLVILAYRSKHAQNLKLLINL